MDTKGNAYSTLGKHIFRAFRKYEGRKTLIIIADNEEQAIKKAQQAFSSNSVSVRRIIATEDPQVYEL